MDELEPVATERVAASISSPLLGERGIELDIEPSPESELTSVPVAEFGLDPPPSVAAHPTWVVAVVVGFASGVASGDPRVGLVFAAAVGFAALTRRIDSRLPFSFGEGFVGYRSDLGWPQGVQEDDDVHWSWRVPTSSTRPMSSSHPISGR